MHPPQPPPPQDLPAASLPSNWGTTSPASATADIGTDWVNSGQSVALRVPSVLTRGEFNVLINPAHADLKRIRVKSTRHYSYDSRMWKA